MIYSPTGYSLKIFKDRYAFTFEETWEEACQRVARQISIAELPDKQKIYENKFNEILLNNLFVPGGRIWYNSGRNNPNLLNCFVLGNNLDSKEGWGNLAREMIITSMHGGGCGIDFSDIRPRGAPISSQKGESPGPIELMKLINGCASPIRAGGARRVALMFSLDLDHPDILEFLNAKLEKGELQFANISVRSKRTTEFIKALKSDGDWELSWKGKFKKTIKAKELWNQITKNAYESAEPGFLNLELGESESNINYLKSLVTTNPCGEQLLGAYENCCLGHLVLPRFIENNEINWNLLGNTVRLGVRFLDNVLDVNYYPLHEMKIESQKVRRIGLGTTGLADALVILGYKYGSQEGNKFIDKLYRFISKAAYESSVMLAIEKGAFPTCDSKKFIESGFMSRMTSKIKALVLEHGIRNCALLTVAPTGTVSILSGNISSGIEPPYSPAYERRYWYENERKTEFVMHPLFEQFLKEKKDLRNFIGATELTVEEHLEVQKIVQKHIDSAVSKTVNISENYSLEEMSNTWLKYLPYLKGTTFYRENTRGYVDKNGNIQEPPLKAIPIKEAIKRYKTENIIIIDTNSLECPSGICKL